MTADGSIGTRYNDDEPHRLHRISDFSGWALALIPVASALVGSLIKKRRKRMRKKKHKKMLRRTRHQRRK